MKPFSIRPFFKKHGKKALIIYVCWFVVKGILLLLLGFKLLG